MKPKWPGFEASPLLLDLIAEDNRHVRSFDPKLDGTVEAPEANPRPDRRSMESLASDFCEEAARYTERWRHVAKDEMNVWRITDLDVMSVAIKDVPPFVRESDMENTAEPGVFAPELFTKSLIYWNGIPLRRQLDSSGVISYMLQRQRESVALDRAPPEYRKTLRERIRFALAACRGYQVINRLFSRLLQTRDGCQLLSECSDDIGNWLAATALEDRELIAKSLLPLANDIALNLDAKDITVGKWFCRAGLILAIECGALPAAQLYLRIGFTVGFYNPSKWKDARHPTLHQLAEALQKLANGASRLPRSEVYRLLTGCESFSDTPRISFCHTIGTRHRPDRSPLYRFYLQLLGLSGALRTLWHEWHGMHGPLGQAHLSPQQSRRKFNLFLPAILGALRIITPHEARRSEFVEATGDCATDRRLDLRDMILSESTTDGDPSIGPDQTAQESRHISIMQGHQAVEILRGSNISEAMFALRTLLLTNDSKVIKKHVLFKEKKRSRPIHRRGPRLSKIIRYVKTASWQDPSKTRKVVV